MQDLSGKVAFVTGGASGIGFGMARVLLRAGMKVVIADIREDHLAECRGQLGDVPGVLYIRLDVTDRAALSQAADATERQLGPVQVLCNNAGVGVIGGAKLATYADWDWGMAVNLGGVINGIQTFLPRMLACGEGGHIVNTSSIGAVLPGAGGIVYLTAKCAILGLSECLCAELAPDDIGVTALCPGPIATNIHEVGRHRPERYRDSGLRDIEQSLAQRSNSPAWMDPLQVGELVLDAILCNRLFVFTHNEFKAGVATRFKAILTGFPPGEPDAARADALGFPVANPLYARILESDA